jgi:hypothetical protein
MNLLVEDQYCQKLLERLDSSCPTVSTELD